MEPQILPFSPAKLPQSLVLYSPASALFSCFPLRTGSSVLGFSVRPNSVLHEAMVDHTTFSNQVPLQCLMVKNTRSSLEATWMNLVGGCLMLGEISQRKASMVSIYMWNILKNTTNQWLKQKNKQTHRYRGQASAYQREKERGRGNTGIVE